jgi:hypothetical protein
MYFMHFSLRGRGYESTWGFSGADGTVPSPPLLLEVAAGELQGRRRTLMEEGEVAWIAGTQ